MDLFAVDWQIPHVHRLFELRKDGDVALDVRRDIAGERVDFDLVDHLQQHTLVRADGIRGADEHDGHLRAHALSHRDLVEVDVEQPVIDGVARDVADDDRAWRAFAFDAEVDDLVAGDAAQ